MVPTNGSKSVQYICLNSDCRKIFELPDQPYYEPGRKLRCACGSEAKRVYTSPTLRRLTKAEAEQVLKHVQLT